MNTEYLALEVEILRMRLVEAGRILGEQQLTIDALRAVVVAKDEYIKILEDEKREAMR